MKRLLMLAACLAFLGSGLSLAQDKRRAPKLTDAKIVKILIQESIDAYPGNCPCPYNRASNGSRCGKRSAWNRKGGYDPLCFESDVTRAMIDAYRKSHEGG